MQRCRNGSHAAPSCRWTSEGSQGPAERASGLPRNPARHFLRIYISSAGYSAPHTDAVRRQVRRWSRPRPRAPARSSRSRRPRLRHRRAPRRRPSGRARSTKERYASSSSGAFDSSSCTDAQRDVERLGLDLVDRSGDTEPRSVTFCDLLDDGAVRIRARGRDMLRERARLLERVEEPVVADRDQQPGTHRALAEGLDLFSGERGAHGDPFVGCARRYRATPLSGGRCCPGSRTPADPGRRQLSRPVGP